MRVICSFLCDEVFVDNFFFFVRTLYVLSDDQQEELKPDQKEKNLESIKDSLKSWERVIKLK